MCGVAVAVACAIAAAVAVGVLVAAPTTVLPMVTSAKATKAVSDATRIAVAIVERLPRRRRPSILALERTAPVPAATALRERAARPATAASRPPARPLSALRRRLPVR